MGGGDQKPTGVVMRDPSYYGKCCFGGVLSCGLTHAGIVTLDLHKCRAQANPGKWPSVLPQGVAQIARTEGYGALITGWAPTLLGYSGQGFCKFGFNEVFQDIYAGAIFGGRHNIDTKPKKMLFQAMASGTAEIFADVALCPFEMTKVKMQVELPPGTEYRTSSVFGALARMNADKANTKFPFGSLKPLWGRQIPYTMIKFVVFYQTAEFVYNYLEKNMGLKKEDVSDAKQLAITFACGYWAGIFCAITTQPMDNLVSMAGNVANKGKSWGQMASEMGTLNLFVKGLGTRIIMIGTLTGFQWWIYGSFKNLMGFGTY